MKLRQQTFHMSLVREDRWFVAQCLEVDIASQGRTEFDAIRNLKEALELHFEEPVATELPKLMNVRASIV